MTYLEAQEVKLPLELSMKWLRENGVVGSRYDYAVGDNSSPPHCSVYDQDTGDTVAVFPVECPELAEAVAAWLSAEDDRLMGVTS